MKCQQLVQNPQAFTNAAGIKALPIHVSGDFKVLLNIPAREFDIPPSSPSPLF